MTEAPQQPAPPPAAAGGGAPAPNPGKGLGIAGMVLGIVAVVLFCVWYIAIPCAVVGLILSIIGKKKSVQAGAPAGMAKAGMILCIIALVIDIIIGVLVMAVLGVAFWGASTLPTQPAMLDALRTFLA
jgi:hypothetical protein